MPLADAPQPELSILYRGALASCNYACSYCPFAKHRESKAEAQADLQGLELLTRWLEGLENYRLQLLFTPWGEALVRPRYQQLLYRLSLLPQIHKLAFQTNLSPSLGFLDQFAPEQLSKLAFWCTFHPSQIKLKRFLAQVKALQQRGIRCSVGVVGLPSQFEAIHELKQNLPEGIYLWVNAWRKGHQLYPYSQEQLAFLKRIDAYFSLNQQAYLSRGLECWAGETVISLDQLGNLRRCHFVGQVLGNIQEPDWQSKLKPRSCPNQHCDCHIGYVHLKSLNLYQTFEGGVLERIPANFS